MTFLHPFLRRAGLIALVGTVLLAIVPPLTAQEAQTPDDLCAAALPAAEPETREFTAPEQVLEAEVDYRAIFCTGAGAVYIDLFEDLTPITVNSFVFLAQQGYFNNTTFHRVIDQFMAQGGDPTGTGRGGPGYQFEDEFVGFLHFDQAGWLAMANAGPGTNGSQFFITTAPAPHLDNRHTIFGQVLDGQDIVEAIRLRDPATDPDPGTSLDTVLIVTDPTTISAEVLPTAPATREEVEAAIAAITTEVPPPLAVDEEATGIFDAETVLAALPQSHAQLLSENGFEYRAQIHINNVECDLERAPYYHIGYTIDVFESRAAAAAVLNSTVLDDFAVGAGFSDSALESPLPKSIYIAQETICETPATRALTFWQRGRFVITASAAFPADSPASPDLWLQELVGVLIYERLLSDILRPEI